MDFSKSSLEVISDYVQRRNKALIEWDMDYFREMSLEVKDEVIEIAMHKARYEIPAIPSELREASRQWLEVHDYKRYGDLPWPEKGLPE